MKNGGLALWFLLLAISSALHSAELGKGLSAAARRDWAEAYQEFKPLAEAGDPNAAVNLGNLYLRGLGVVENPREAFRWFKQAAEQGHPKGEGKLGMMYYYGLGTIENREEAIHWFKKAAEQGDPESASILGSIHSIGEGAKKDPVEAYLWYSIASDRGKPGAQEQRGLLMEEMTPSEQTEALNRLDAWRQQHAPLPKEEGIEAAKPAQKLASSHPVKRHVKKRRRRHARRHHSK